MSGTRRPRLRVLADGTEIEGVIEAEVHANNHYAADVYSVRLATSAGTGLGDWAGATDTLIEVQFGLTADPAFGGWTSLITGRIDSLEADAIRGVLHIEGRDLSAALIQARTRESFANQTASDIATLFAGRHGLAAQVTATTTLVGRYYGDDHTRLTLDRLARTSTEWDLLVFLAQQENFDVFVSGTTLFFQPVQEGAAPTLVLSPVAGLNGPANVSSLRLHRSMALSGDISVTVRSWNSQQQMVFSETATRAGDGGPACTYAYVRPNLTQDGATELATRKLTALTRHEFVLNASMPGDLDLAPRDTVQLVGTASAFDQVYIVDTISRRLNAREGFVQSLRAYVPSGSADFTITGTTASTATATGAGTADTDGAP